ncbi:MAG: TatD family hydrolase [Clostridiales Family XIII bacterium]|nr:TatD family hydrolase [Clostridiales Family XIII bacterium]
MKVSEDNVDSRDEAGGVLFDSHTHINYDDMNEDERNVLIREIEASDVGVVIDVGFDLPSSELSAALAQVYPWYYAAVGIHPHDADKLDDAALSRLRELSQLDRVMAVGEIGLDYYRDISPRDVQRDAFKRQIHLALETGLPMLIHDRDSGGEAIEMLIREGALVKKGSDIKDTVKSSLDDKSADKGNPRVLLHCYSGTADEALDYIDMGAMISVAGPVTYKKNERLHEVARRVPLSSMLIETDAPFLSPVPYRGKRNKSPYIEYTADAIAQLRGISYEEVAAATFENGCRFFGIRR